MEWNHECGRLVKRLNTALQQIANRQMEEENLTLAQSEMLAVLSRMGGRASLKELERELYLAQSTTHGIAARLISKGFLIAEGDPADRRVRFVRLTEKGLARMERLKPEIIAMEDSLLECLPEKERERFLNDLRAVCEQADRMMEEKENGENSYESEQ